MIANQKNIVAILGLIAVLAIGPVAPEASNIIYLSVGTLGLLLVGRDASTMGRRPVVALSLLGAAFIGVAYTVSAGPEGLLGLAYFSPMLVIGPLIVMLRGSSVRDLGLLVGMLALCGVAAASIMVTLEVIATGTRRAGVDIANPIHFADVALLVGFLGLGGAAFARGRWRLVFLAAPALAIIAVALSGTRGAMVAFLAMILVAAASATVVGLVRRRFAMGGIAAILVLGTIVLAAGGNQIPGVARFLTDMAGAVSHGVPTDHSTNLRLQMYLGGWLAFLEAPIFGHGPFDFTAVAEQLAASSFEGAPHLHNDPVDMAASAGLLGLAAYALLLAAPIVEAFRAPRSDLRPWTILLALTLVSGFFIMGLTNAMFGILSVTTTYSVICVVIGMMASVEGESPV